MKSGRKNCCCTKPLGKLFLCVLDIDDVNEVNKGIEAQQEEDCHLQSLTQRAPKLLVAHDGRTHSRALTYEVRHQPLSEVFCLDGDDSVGCQAEDTGDEEVEQYNQQLQYGSTRARVLIVTFICEILEGGKNKFIVILN